MVVLTLGIPTYKSNGSLFRLLDSIFSQITQDTFPKIEVVISDNNPDSELLTLLRSKLSPVDLKIVKYNRNKSNIGYDKNLEKLRELSTGKYLKIIADDDMLDIGYLNNHLQILEEKNPDIIVNEFQSFSLDPVESLNDQSASDANYFLPPWTLLKLEKLNGRFGQVSSLTFRLALLRDLPEQEVETNFIHLFWFYSLIEKSTLVYEKKVTIFCQLGSPNFSSNFSEIISISFGAVKASRIAKIHEPILRKQIIKSHQNYAFKQLRLVPSLSLSQKLLIFKKFRLEFLDGFPAILIYFPLFFVPRSMKVQLGKIIGVESKSSK